MLAKITQIPVNRWVAFLGPVIAIITGGIADWLVLKVHILGSLGVNHDAIASALAWVLIGGVTAGLTWFGQSSWLRGHQQWTSEIMSLLHLLPAGLPEALLKDLEVELEKLFGHTVSLSPHVQAKAVTAGKPPGKS